MAPGCGSLGVIRSTGKHPVALMTGLRVALEIVDVVGARFCAGLACVMLARRRGRRGGPSGGRRRGHRGTPVLADPPIGRAVDVDVLNRARVPDYREAVHGSDPPAAELRPDGDEVVLGD